MIRVIVLSLAIAGSICAEEVAKPDAAALEAVLENEPENASNVYALACLYNGQGEFQKALELFEKRTAMGGCEEEIYHSLYRIGTIQESLEMAPELISNSFCKAFVYSPNRAEPIFRLTQYLNKKQNFPLSYTLSKLALAISKPESGIEIESWVYEYGLLSEFAQSAFCLGRIEESCNAYERLLTLNLPEPLKQSIQQSLDQTKLTIQSK